MRGAAALTCSGVSNITPAGRLHEAGEGRLLGVADGAALLDDRLHLGEGDRLRRRGRCHRSRRASARSRSRGRPAARSPPPAARAAFLPTWRSTKYCRISAPASMMTARIAQPCRAAVGHRVVVADHDEQHRQREVGVVHAALLADDRPASGRGALPARISAHHLLLPGDDLEEDVPHHDRADQRADVDVGGTPAEHLGVAPGRRDQQHVDHDRQRELVLDGPAQRVVDQPADDERTGRDRDRRRDRRAPSPTGR